MASDIPIIVRKLPRGGMIWCEECLGFWFKDDHGKIGHIRTKGPKCRYETMMDFIEANT